MSEYLDFFDEMTEAIEQVFAKFHSHGDKKTKDDLLQVVEFLDNHDFFEQFSESKKVMNKALFEDIYKSGGGRLQEVKASLAANVLTKYMNNYIKGGQIPADASDLAKQFSMNLGQAARTGSEGIDNDNLYRVILHVISNALRCFGIEFNRCIAMRMAGKYQLCRVAETRSKLYNVVIGGDIHGIKHCLC